MQSRYLNHKRCKNIYIYNSYNNHKSQKLTFNKEEVYEFSRLLGYYAIGCFRTVVYSRNVGGKQTYAA